VVQFSSICMFLKHFTNPHRDPCYHPFLYDFMRIGAIIKYSHMNRRPTGHFLAFAGAASCLVAFFVSDVVLSSGSVAELIFTYILFPFILTLFLFSFHPINCLKTLFFLLLSSFFPSSSTISLIGHLCIWVICCTLCH